MKIKTKKDRRVRIALRQRKRINGTSERPRLRVFRSVSHIYAQVIDDMSGTTIVSAASTEPTLKSVFTEKTRAATSRRQSAGQDHRGASQEKGIKRVVFDRGGFLYHGRIRAVADAAREAGLEF